MFYFRFAVFTVQLFGNISCDEVGALLATVVEKKIAMEMVRGNPDHFATVFFWDAKMMDDDLS